jgi:fructose/tagatose bisphosphate aldolase
MLFKFETGAVYMAMEKFIAEYKDNYTPVGFMDYDHIFGIYETLTRTAVKPSSVMLDESEFALLEEFF